ncbi:MAG: GDSL-type esterase/lipase family protein [Clostridium sp.]|nr:GDSL-type esterase/lipase family protein [Bacteroides sp.]MCM1198836.1 GDSL-type esterase/lipase family protein [Clostridium sp.]
MKKMLFALCLSVLSLSCSKGVEQEEKFPPLYIYGTAAEGIPLGKKNPMSDVYDVSNAVVEGCFETYLEFTPGEYTVVDENGCTWRLDDNGLAVKDGGQSTFEDEGIYRICVDCKSSSWSMVRIDNLSFKSLYGNMQTVAGEYSGLGRWTFDGIPLSADDGEAKYYLFEVESDSPELAFLCSTRDMNLSDPDSYRSSASFVRSMDEDTYSALSRKNGENACAFRFISSDKGTASIRLQLTRGQSRYIHYVEITPPGPDAAFMGDSITENWKKSSTGHPEFFTDNGYLNFGISGQTTSQMLARFEREVVANAPQCVVICGGTNDIAGNGGNVTNEQILRNIQDMAEMAEKANIKVILCSILPTNYYWWATSVNPVERIADMNSRIMKLCSANGWPYVDYFTPMVNSSDKGILDIYSDDRIHPNKSGYTVMEKIVKPVIDSAIK